MQTARNQSFADGPKTRHLYDTDDFAEEASFAPFLRKLVEINRIGTKRALLETFKFRVKKNTCPSRKPKNALFRDPTFDGRVIVGETLTAAAKMTETRKHFAKDWKPSRVTYGKRRKVHLDTTTRTSAPPHEPE
jgi:hypothetical protein